MLTQHVAFMKTRQNTPAIFRLNDAIDSLKRSNVKSRGSYLHMSVFPCEKSNGWQASDDAALQDKYCRSHQPVEGYDTGRAILAGLASLGARQAFKHSALGILALLTLLTNTRLFLSRREKTLRKGMRSPVTAVPRN